MASNHLHRDTNPAKPAHGTPAKLPSPPRNPTHLDANRAKPAPGTPAILTSFPARADL